LRPNNENHGRAVFEFGRKEVLGHQHRDRKTSEQGKNKNLKIELQACVNGRPVQKFPAGRGQKSDGKYQVK
jgi:hypothetical protein